MLVINRKVKEGVFIGDVEMRILYFINGGMTVKFVTADSILGPNVLHMFPQKEYAVGFATVTLFRIRENIARIGIHAPREIKILRSELKRERKNDRSRRLGING